MLVGHPASLPRFPRQAESEGLWTGDGRKTRWAGDGHGRPERPGRPGRHGAMMSGAPLVGLQGLGWSPLQIL